MRLVRVNKGSETKPGIFPQDIFKSDVSFLGQKFSVKLKNPNLSFSLISAYKVNEIKSDMFPQDLFKSEINVSSQKMKYFNEI